MVEELIARALALFALLTQGWGDPALVARCEFMPRGMLKGMAWRVADIEALARAAILAAAQGLRSRVCARRGGGRGPSAGRRPGGGPEAPPETWAVRFILFPRGRKAKAPPTRRKPAPRTYKLKLSDITGERPPRKESAGGVRAERSRVGCGRARGPSARQEAIDAYWRGSPNEDSWPEEKVRYDSTWPLARRMEGVRRAMLRPDHYARLAARRLRARTIVAKFGRQPAQEDAAAPEKETANKPAPAWKPPWVPRE